MDDFSRDKVIQKKLDEAAKKAGIDEVYSLYNFKKDWWDVTVYIWHNNQIVRGEYHMDSIIDDADAVIARAVESAKRGQHA